MSMNPRVQWNELLWEHEPDRTFAQMNCMAMKVSHQTINGSRFYKREQLLDNFGAIVPYIVNPAGGFLPNPAYMEQAASVPRADFGVHDALGRYPENAAHAGAPYVNVTEPNVEYFELRHTIQPVQS